MENKSEQFIDRKFEKLDWMHFIPLYGLYHAKQGLLNDLISDGKPLFVKGNLKFIVYLAWQAVSFGTISAAVIAYCNKGSGKLYPW